MRRIRRRNKEVEVLPKYIDKKTGRTITFIEGNRYFTDELVAETFLKKPIGATKVRHINGDLTDDRAVNLEWV